ncbi:hypothetical protein OG909_26435 [Streptomyces sp. NBC_01754]|uniref:hypothetical protein n=1 Tax=Streptomyces sp. NBC_01754 TaxID=2975930 RepID=UPI002DDA5E90|nr:hypothetical protein [Streptomyces sp. NBC_01754]WSC95542.1 hypothetical protein OG909_26435 [Streptomyces sp. NBC_01754]
MSDTAPSASRAALLAVRPWHSLASLGVTESDLTSTRNPSWPSGERRGHGTDRSRTTRKGA